MAQRDPKRPTPEIHRITSAQAALSEQQSRRTRRYLISMTIRTACFLAAVFSHGWWQWAFLVGAVFLPYIAVVAANAGRENDPFANELVTPNDLSSLPPARGLVIEPGKDSFRD